MKETILALGCGHKCCSAILGIVHNFVNNIPDYHQPLVCSYT